MANLQPATTPELPPAVKMAELRVFAKAAAIGLIGAEVLRATFLIGHSFAATHSSWSPWATTTLIALPVLLCLAYARERNAYLTIARLGRSLRLDLLIAVGFGVWVNILTAPWLSDPHNALQHADPLWAPALLLLLSTLLASPLYAKYRPRPNKIKPQLYFIPDEEVSDKSEDHLEIHAQATRFASVVLEGGAHKGLVFGVDGPWGVGKTSFINLAQKHWATAANEVIVCRFEPLRYATDPDLSTRLIKEISAAIQRAVFAPEFGPAASRYYRILKGKADISFLGLKLSLEPSNETIDELLEDVDDVLKRIERRVIIVVDDLDRLEPSTINNVLFATRRTFKLSQATYVLCYDSDILSGNRDGGEEAREFLEKFVTAKLSLFIDSEQLRRFLKADWTNSQTSLATIPSDTMVKLGAVLNELAEILNSEHAAQYFPLVGNLRKVKRFLNSLLLMQLEKTDLGRTDFNRRDLIHLVLLHLNYTGLFRRIYQEETEGRIGAFSVRRAPDRTYVNAGEFERIIKDAPIPARFLLQQLFDVTSLDLNTVPKDEGFLRSRACFNQPNARNLESYLKLFVRFAAPEPRTTFILYQAAVDEVKGGRSIRQIFKRPDFLLINGDESHDQFWRVLVNQAHSFNRQSAEEAIETLIEYLPKYPAVDVLDRGLRHRSVYSLLRLLDRAGWGRATSGRRANTDENVSEIARRMFGLGEYVGKSLVQSLASPERGVLGWYDLMLFRLQCSADRLGELYNLQRALIIHEDPKAATSGAVTALALVGMRRISQAVFSHFRSTYIQSGRNFFNEVNAVPDPAFWGDTDASRLKSGSRAAESLDSQQLLAAARNGVKSFVIYQLGNNFPPTGSGVGCGFYDQEGNGDRAGISKEMHQYVFDFCFNPEVAEENVFHFLDYCLSHFVSPFFAGIDDEDAITQGKFVPTKNSISGGLDPLEMAAFWRRHGALIKQKNPEQLTRTVATPNYAASYREHLPKALAVLDELVESGPHAAH